MEGFVGNNEQRSGEAQGFDVENKTIDVFEGDPHKVEKLVKAGRSKLGSDAGSD